MDTKTNKEISFEKVNEFFPGMFKTGDDDKFFFVDESVSVNPFTCYVWFVYHKTVHYRIALYYQTTHAHSPPYMNFIVEDGKVHGTFETSEGADLSVDFCVALFNFGIKHITYLNKSFQVLHYDMDAIMRSHTIKQILL